MDSARLFAALRAAKAHNFELELELIDARKKLLSSALSPHAERNTVPWRDNGTLCAGDTQFWTGSSNDSLDSGLQFWPSDPQPRPQERSIMSECGTQEPRGSTLVFRTSSPELEIAHVVDAHNAANAAFTAASARLEGLEAALTATAADEALRVNNDITVALNEAKRANKSEFEAKIIAAESATRMAQEKANFERCKRRALHNRIMELQGNIRVLCRCRPPRDTRDAESAAKFPEDGIIHIARPKYEGDDCEFEFDGVFSPDVPQAAIFESVRDLACPPSHSLIC